jgi:broad specificity phosphatase PhoE
MRHVYLLRHGEAENPSGVIYGRLPGFGLSARGREQVQAAAARLQAIVNNGPTAIVSSPLARARDSAGIVSEALGVPVAIDDRLSEAHSVFDGLVRRGKVHEMARRATTPRAWLENERPAAVLRRMREAVRATTGDVVLVSHQFPIWMARVAFEHGGAFAERFPWLFARGRCELASITTLRFADDRWRETSYWSQ